jgi:Ser/Thr protein kinase RdoA (MazF antagonist)
LKAHPDPRLAAQQWSACAGLWGVGIPRDIRARATTNRYAPVLVETIAAQFDISGTFVGAEPIGSGHIHDTFVARHEHSATPSPRGLPERHIFQRINTDVFRDPVSLMDNISRVCAHLRSTLESGHVDDANRRCMQVIATRSGSPIWRDEHGAHWRCFRFQERTRSVDAVESPEQAYQAARAFAQFVRRLEGLPGPPLAETIPHFHDLPYRYATLQAAVRADVIGRARALGLEIEQTDAVYESLTAELSQSGFSELPARIVHNDCKINNVLLDEQSGEGMCVIDLDTVMTGSVVSDFGQLVRTSACRSPEDETRTETMTIEPDLLRALAFGYCEGAQSLLTPAEHEVLPLAGSAMALEDGVRFLTDHLQGDVYYKIQRPNHNLDRFRAQLRLVELLNRERGFLRDALRRAQSKASA